MYNKPEPATEKTTSSDHLSGTFGGLLFGYDTGVINGAFSSLKQYMALTPTTEGLVMSVLLVGAALGKPCLRCD
ncbi:hypothetical protein CKF46_02465, partial [Klebsiella pneumoniae]